jgi:hypothetical protein
MNGQVAFLDHDHPADAEGRKVVEGGVDDRGVRFFGGVHHAGLDEGYIVEDFGGAAKVFNEDVSA